MTYTTAEMVAKRIGKPALAGPPADPFLQECVDGAEFYINNHTGRTTSIVPTPPGLGIIALSLAIDLYKQPDATFGIIGAGETGPVRIARDLQNRYDSLLIPYYDGINGWGVTS